MLETLSHKKIFLTGGTGFFGKSILSMLKRGFLQDTEFLILSRNAERFLVLFPEFRNLNRVRFLQGDVRDFSFPDESFDYIIHAATPAVTTLPKGEMRSIIMEGTQRVIEFARFSGVEKLMLTSSGAVYGPCPPEIEKFSETFSCNPVTEYGIAKLDSEKMCCDSGIFTLLPRCFAFVGPYLDLDIHFAIGNFIRDAMKKQDILIKGDGTPYRSYLYADDLVNWLFTILDRGENGRPYNVGSPEEISIMDLAEKVVSLLSPQSTVKRLISPVQGVVPARYIPDTRRACEELSLEIMVALDEAIVQTVDLIQKRTFS